MVINGLAKDMEYTDPYHKRTEFSADSFSCSGDGGSRTITFVGHGQHAVVLREQDSTVVVVVPEAECHFVLWKAQILQKLKWLTLDFSGNPLLTRIVIHIDHLDAGELDAAMRALIASRSVLYYGRR